MAPPRAAALAVVIALAGACTEDFLPASVVVDERVIAVTASPPEAVPGQEVTLTPLVVSPGGELAPADAFTALWWRCPDGDSDALGDFVPCTVPSERIDLGAAVPYVDTVPADLFGDLTAAPADEGEALTSDKLFGAILGYWRVVGLTVTANDKTVDAFKRIPVYLPVRLGDVDPRLAALDSRVDEDGNDLGPNTNPVLTGVLVHAESPAGPTVAKVSADTGPYFFQPLFLDDALQAYQSLKVELAGLDLSSPEALRDVPVEDLLARFQKVSRCEIPTFSWFVTHGRVRQDTSLDEGVVKRVFDARGVDCPPVEGEQRIPEVQYEPPAGTDEDPAPVDGIVRGWVVMRDGRGGTATRGFEMTVETP